MMTALRGKLYEQEPMAKHTSWKVGGIADRLYRPADLDDLQVFLQSLPSNEPLTWVGLGSNLLVRDGGIRGTVIKMAGGLTELEKLDDQHVFAGAGVNCAKLARQAADWGMGNTAFFAGIPGSFGGALAMNAGAYGSETWEFVQRAKLINRAGEVIERQPTEFEIAYRTVIGKADEWFIGATLAFPLDKAESGAPTGVQQIKALLEQRKQSQPVDKRSCGSVFRNPKDDYAARLIEVSGLKGFRIGGAAVSEKHANFIINEGAATAADIEHLIAHLRNEVERLHGVRLHTEVRMIGDDA